MDRAAHALIVTGREMRNANGVLISKEGERYWVCEDRDGWGATSTRCTDPRAVPGHVKTFDTEEEAKHFAAHWKGAPWWCSPTGEHEIVLVRQNFRRVHAGYSRLTRTA